MNHRKILPLLEHPILIKSNLIVTMLLILRELKKKRLGFDLVRRASFHLTVPIQESSTKTDSCLYKTVSNSGVPDSFKCHSLIRGCTSVKLSI